VEMLNMSWKSKQNEMNNIVSAQVNAIMR
jgi:hypothetical protein